MTGLPDIIIPEKRGHPHLLVELPREWGVLLVEFTSDDPPVDMDESTPFWRFKDREGLYVFAAARLRDNCRQGLMTVTPGYPRLYAHCYDTRTQYEVGRLMTTREEQQLVW